jgi:glutaredoxin-related protein
MKVYGTEICIDCRNLKHIMETRKLNLEYIDITENTANLKKFLRLRDTSEAFAECRQRGGIGIPCFVDEENVTLDIDEAFSWIGQEPVKEEEIREKRK